MTTAPAPLPSASAGTDDLVESDLRTIRAFATLMHGRSPKTKDAYEGSLVRWRSRLPATASLLTLTRPEWNDLWAHACAGRPLHPGDTGAVRWQPTTQRRELAALRKFYKWRGEVDATVRDAVGGLEAAPVRKKGHSQRSLTPEQVDAVMRYYALRTEAAQSHPTRYALALFEQTWAGWCYYTGARVHEPATIQIESIRTRTIPHPETGAPVVTRTCAVLGKGNKEALLFIPDEFWPVLSAWIALRTSLMPMKERTGDLMVHPVRRTPCLPNWLQRRLPSTIAEAAGYLQDGVLDELIDEIDSGVPGKPPVRRARVTAHWFRHSLCNHLLTRFNLPVQSAQLILRHSSIQTTQDYIEDQQLAAATAMAGFGARAT